MSDKNKKFVLNDETVENSYGFYVRTAGIKLDRFLSNPVMLSDHNNTNLAVLGKWLELEKNGHQLLGLPEFDVADPDAKKIAGKVDRGYIKGASMGLLMKGADMVYVDNKIILMECELVEGTIIPVPSNPRSLRLYLQDGGEPLTEDEVKNLCLSIQPETPTNFNQNPDMKKIILSLGALIALGFKDAPKDGLEESEIEAKILGLSAKLETSEKEVLRLKAENEQLQTAAKTQTTADGKLFLAAAVEAGKIKADQVEAYLSLYEANPALTKSTIDAIPAKTSLGAKIVPGGGQGDVEIKTADDFEKLDHEAKLSWKAANPDEYKKLFN